MDKKGYIAKMREDLRSHRKHSKTSIEKVAKGFGITNKNLVKECTELAIVLNAREVAHDTKLSTYEKYQAIVALYQSQVNISMRTSISVMLQQYSTPAPISFLASSYILNHKPTGLYFEPSAGNGLLTIALPYARTCVNEIDEVRHANLKSQPYLKVTNKDALQPFKDYYRKFDGVVTNPPFGRLTEPIEYNDFKIKVLDHAMCINALECMADHGKAALIIGGHTEWDKMGRPQAGKNRIFLNYLYHNYNVEDVISIDGKKLYSRQGTGMNVRLILINGRKKTPAGAAPLKNASLEEVVHDFDRLWERVGGNATDNKRKRRLKLAKLKAKAILILQQQEEDKAEKLSYESLDEGEQYKVDMTYKGLLKKIGPKKEHKTFEAARQWSNEKLKGIRDQRTRALIAVVIDKLNKEEERRKQERKEKRAIKQKQIEKRGMLKPKFTAMSLDFFYDLVDDVKDIITQEFYADAVAESFVRNQAKCAWEIWNYLRTKKQGGGKTQKAYEAWMDRLRKEDLKDKNIESTMVYIIRNILKNHKK